MPEFQRKNQKLLHKGINWNAPVDLMPEGQVPYARNVRVIQGGTISQRPGLTDYQNLSGLSSYIHTISRLNNSDANVNFSRALILCKDTQLYVGGVPRTYADEAAANNFIKTSLASSYFNPCPLPEGITLSGNPLSIVDMAPVGSNAGWKYCGDRGGNFAIGYYPGDSTTDNGGPNNGYARVIPMGIKPPIIGTGNANMLVYNTGTDNLNGLYQWEFAFRNKFTGARSNPSAPTRDSQAEPNTTLLNGYVTFTLPASPDPVNIAVDVYRIGGNVPDWRYVGTGSAGTLFTDNSADADILNASLPPGVMDPVTKIYRNNLYQPFITQDYARFGNGILNVSVAGVWSLNYSSGDHFDAGWLRGSFISINNGSFSIYEASSTVQVIISEDLSGLMVGGVPVTNGTVVPWSTHAGTLTMGSALSHIWGPYGLGESGAYIFGCGDPNNAGTLYWTNGNDPDSTDLVNSVIVTSPSEPLKGGCVYDGTPFIWSTERMFRIYPASIAGQFTVQEVPGSKGLWAEWSLTVQTVGIADQSVTWVGKDAIYDWSATGGLRTMTDRDLLPFFPHDNQPGINVATLLPWLAEPTPVQAPNFDATKQRYHRLMWFQGELFYDFPAGATDYYTLVYDSKQVNAWVSVDQFASWAGGTSQQPIGRGMEIAGNNMFVAVGGWLLTNTGTTDFGFTIACRFTTRSDDLGDPRVMKMYGDYMLDANTGGVAVTCKTWLNHYLTNAATTTITTSARGQKIFDFSTGLGVLGVAHALDFTWNATAPVTLYQWAYSYVPKPEQTSLRCTDKTDDGYNGAKYLRGLCVEANTFNADKRFDVLVDGIFAAALTINTNGQLEIPFAITPLAGSEFQVIPTDPNTWEIFAIRWTWEKWPDLTQLESNWLDMGTAKPKYVRSFTMPVAGVTQPLSFRATYDGAQTYDTTSIAPPTSGVAKPPAQFSFNPPILAHELKLHPSVPCRCWYDQIVWDAEEWPELATLYGPQERLGNDSGAKYVRGFNLPIETGGGSVVISLLHDSQNGNNGTTVSQDMPPVSTTALSKNVFAFTPTIPCIGHIFQIRSNSPARFWYNEVQWEFEPVPEFDTGPSPWTDCGNPGIKFMQGLVLALDTGGQSVMFDLTYDILEGTATFPIGPFITQAGFKSPVPYSFVVPFLAHELQLSPRTPCRCWYPEIKWVWEPLPELVTTYTTQETDLDLPGWHYQFDAYIAYIGTTDAPVLHIKTEYGTIDYVLPISDGVFTRAHVQLQPQKAKWRSFSVTSVTGVRLYLKDCEIRAKAWTDKGNYPAAFQSHHPFGDESRAVGARI